MYALAKLLRHLRSCSWNKGSYRLRSRSCTLAEGELHARTPAHRYLSGLYVFLCTSIGTHTRWTVTIFMLLGILREHKPGETRVALSPDGIPAAQKLGLEVGLESGAGNSSSFSDASYEEQGARIYSDRAALLAAADIVAHIHPPEEQTMAGLKEHATWISFIHPHENEDLLGKMALAGITVLSMESIPRISRAQSMDALSSMASIAGYKAVLIASSALGKYMPMLMTAAGTIPPAKVLVLGAGVAGLQAIATARRLGAVVEAFDVRSAVKEQVESLGASFVEVHLEQDAEGEGGYARELDASAQDRQRALIHKHVAKSDIVITTALIPGKRAPLLVTEPMINDMAPGSVILDMAAAQGGNCELSKPDETVAAHGVTIFGPTNLPATMPVHASRLYGKNMLALLGHLMKDGTISFDFEDQITRHTTLTHNGERIA